MTREELKKHWKIVKAFKNGAEIECLDEDGKWSNVIEPSFNIKSKYRIKEQLK